GHLGTRSYRFDRGMGTLPEALANRVTVRLGCAVHRIEHDGTGSTIHYREGDAEHNLHADRVVVATPGHRVLDLLERPRPQWTKFFSTVRYPSVITQYHVFEPPADFDPRTAPADGVMIPDPEAGYTISFVYFVTQHDGRWLAMTEPKAHRSDLAEDVETAAHRSWRDVERIYPELTGTRIASTHYAWDGKVPAFPVGYLDALARFRADPAEGPLYFCGDYLSGPGTGAALYTGWKAADRMLAATTQDSV
ncbi:MAG TPA: FAD-dependent oxidoreductase, partial [Terrimesophilobacter sp.]|nr:FAD-dependent oxidoreductase [Terrimesophilobacter sp.]